MEHIIFFLGIIWLAFVWAKVEIAIEGRHGWAENLPCKRLPANHWISKLFFGGRPATEYHAWWNVFLISLIHAVYFFVDFSWAIELKLIAFVLLFWMVEDFLWFMLNPAYGFKNYKPEKIWWHKNSWWHIAPREVFILVPLGLILYYISLG